MRPRASAPCSCAMACRSNRCFTVPGTSMAAARVTESVLLAAGLGRACELARDLAPMDRVRALRDRFWEALQKQFGNRMRLNGHPTHRLPNTLNVSFVGRIGAEILERLDGVAASTGSACHSGRIELS